MAELSLRAIAKIAFHYMLKLFPALSGHEREFDRIKDTSGAVPAVDKSAQFRWLSEQFWENFRRGERPRCWAHLLTVEGTYDHAVACVQLFAGPGGLPSPHLIDLGTDPARIVAPW